MQQLRNIGLVLGVTFSVFFVSFIVLAWSDPTEGPTGGSVYIPINESASSQVKIGSFEVGGVFITNSATKLAQGNYSSSVTIGSSSTSSNLLVHGGVSVTSEPVNPMDVVTKNYLDAELARIEAMVSGSLPLVYNVHTREACIDAGGEVVDSDVSLPICRFNQATCPANWTQYKGFTTTVYNGHCDCAGACDTSCQGCTTYCNPGHHSWANGGREGCSVSCPYKQRACNRIGAWWCSASARVTQIGCY